MFNVVRCSEEVPIRHSKAVRTNFPLCPYFQSKVSLFDQLSPYFRSRLVGKYAVAQNVLCASNDSLGHIAEAIREPRCIFKTTSFVFNDRLKVASVLKKYSR